MSAPVHNPTRVALDELIALSAVAHGASLARSRRSPALRAGGHASRWRGRGVDFRESRIYLPGDEIRHMDWRVTARSGTPHTKVYQEEREQGLLLVMDLNPGMRFGTRVRSDSAAASTTRSSRLPAVAVYCMFCVRCATGTRPPIPRARMRCPPVLHACADCCVPACAWCC